MKKASENEGVIDFSGPKYEAYGQQWEDDSVQNEATRMT